MWVLLATFHPFLYLFKFQKYFCFHLTFIFPTSMEIWNLKKLDHVGKIINRAIIVKPVKNYCLILNQCILDLYSTVKGQKSENHHLGYIPLTRDLGGYFKEYAHSQEQNLTEYLKINITAVLKIQAHGARNQVCFQCYATVYTLSYYTVTIESRAQKMISECKGP